MPREGPLCGPFPEPRSSGPALCLSFPHSMAMGSSPTERSPWALAGRADLTIPALPKLPQGQRTLTLLEDKARPLPPAGVRSVMG